LCQASQIRCRAPTLAASWRPCRARFVEQLAKKIPFDLVILLQTVEVVLWRRGAR
jgi:hypothetical protein